MSMHSLGINCIILQCKWHYVMKAKNDDMENCGTADGLLILFRRMKIFKVNYNIKKKNYFGKTFKC